MASDDLSIKTLIRAVTKDLAASQKERETDGDPALFQIDALTIEVSFVVTSSKHGGGGFDLKVVKADAGKQYDEQSIHKITLALKATDDEEVVFEPAATDPDARNRSGGGGGPSNVDLGKTAKRHIAGALPHVGEGSP